MYILFKQSTWILWKTKKNYYLFIKIIFSPSNICQRLTQSSAVYTFQSIKNACREVLILVNGIKNVTRSHIWWIRWLVNDICWVFGQKHMLCELRNSAFLWCKIQKLPSHTFGLLWRIFFRKNSSCTPYWQFVHLEEI